ncbi:MAG: pyridoxal 5'-phosphate synthase glutaminase subunit PdxT [Dehalococcoidia bacterium]
MTTVAPPTPQTVGILALQGDFREHREMLEGMGHYGYEIRKPAELRDLDALIIPGGESTTIARLIISNGFQQPLKDFCASGRPVWGTCAGAILLAREVDNLDRPGIETMNIRVRRNAFGRQVDSFEAALDIKGLEGGPFHAVFIRAPVIEAVEPPAGVLCRLDDGTIVAARQANLLATSFHPELTHDSRLHAYFLTIGMGIQRQARQTALPQGLPANLAPFFDRAGRLARWPTREAPQRAATAWLATQFEPDRRYSEAEVNILLDQHHTFHDPALLRRMLFDLGYVDRERDGGAYWVATVAPNPAGGTQEHE